MRAFIVGLCLTLAAACYSPGSPLVNLADPCANSPCDNDKVCVVTGETYVCDTFDCTDGIKNGDELMVDCGGSCALGCFSKEQRAASGFEHSCAILGSADSGALTCWGWNESGQLGLEDTVSRGDGPGEMGSALPFVNLGSGRSAIAVAASAYTTCALLDTHQLKCFGANTDGQLGLPGSPGAESGTMGDSLPAINLGTGRTVRSIASGEWHNCAILDDGALKCWGNNASGQLGLGDVRDRGKLVDDMGDNLPPIDLGAGRRALSIHTGTSHNCALLDDRTLKCWGGNDWGQLGLGDTESRGDEPGEMGDALPTVSLGTNFTIATVSVRGNQTCAASTVGAVKCWGYNSNGQLGQGDNTNRGGAPNQMGDNLPAIDLGESGTVKALAGGAYFQCALFSNNRLKCWGVGSDGELGNESQSSVGELPGQMGSELVAVNVGTGRIVESLAVGLSHVCARLDDGSLKCWGSNGRGELGLGNTTSRGGKPGDMGDNLPVVALQ